MFYSFSQSCDLQIVFCKGIEKSSSHGDRIEVTTISAALIETKSRIHVSSCPITSSKKFNVSEEL